MNEGIDVNVSAEAGIDPRMHPVHDGELLLDWARRVLAETGLSNGLEAVKVEMHAGIQFVPSEIAGGGLTQSETQMAKVILVTPERVERIKMQQAMEYDQQRAGAADAARMVSQRILPPK